MSEIGQKIINAIRKVAEQNPDKTVPSGNCCYVKEGQPSCLVGMALHDVGLLGKLLGTDDYGTFDKSVTYDSGDEFDGDGGRNFPNNERFEDLVEETHGEDTSYGIFGEPIDRDEVEWIDTAQRQQDDQTPWAVAVSVADSRTETEEE